MPNLLTHFGATYLLFWPLPWRIDLRLLFLGALLPDLPWIIYRALERLTALDPINLLAYLIPFSTPIVVLLVAACIALLHQRPLTCFGILGTAGVLNIVLDALQTRPVSGPLLLYPFSFRQYSLHWFWSEDIISYVAVGVSLVCIAFALRRPIWPTPFRLQNLGLVVSLLFGICVLISLTHKPLIAQNVYTLGFASQPEKWEGEWVTLEFDPVVERNLVQVHPSRGLRVQVMGDVDLQPGEGVTLGGFYRDGKIYPEMIRRHRGGLRDLFSYAALLIFVAVWFDIPGRLHTWKKNNFEGSSGKPEAAAS